MLAAAVALTVLCALVGSGWVYGANTQTARMEQQLRTALDARETPATLLMRLRLAYGSTTLGGWLGRQLRGAHLTVEALDATGIIAVLWVAGWRSGTSVLGLTPTNAALVATGTIMIGVRVYLASRRGWLIQKFNEQMPDVAWMMGNAMRAGLSVAQGIELLGAETVKPCGPVFQDMSAQIRLNRPLPEVFQETQGHWKESREFRLFVLTILIQYRSGGNLALALEELSRTLAERKGINEEIRAAIAGPRSSAMILPFMPIIASAVMNMAIPGFLNVLFTGWGLVLLIPFLLIQWMAFTVMRRLSDIQV